MINEGNSLLSFILLLEQIVELSFFALVLEAIGGLVGSLFSALVGALKVVVEFWPGMLSNKPELILDGEAQSNELTWFVAYFIVGEGAKSVGVLVPLADLDIQNDRFSDAPERIQIAGQILLYLLCGPTADFTTSIASDVERQHVRLHSWNNPGG